jgi:hypothetical protein
MTSWLLKMAKLIVTFRNLGHVPRWKTSNFWDMIDPVVRWELRFIFCILALSRRWTLGSLHTLASKLRRLLLRSEQYVRDVWILINTNVSFLSVGMSKVINKLSATFTNRDCPPYHYAKGRPVQTFYWEYLK